MHKVIALFIQPGSLARLFLSESNLHYLGEGILLLNRAAREDQSSTHEIIHRPLPQDYKNTDAAGHDPPGKP